MNTERGLLLNSLDHSRVTVASARDANARLEIEEPTPRDISYPATLSMVYDDVVAFGCSLDCWREMLSQHFQRRARAVGTAE